MLHLPASVLDVLKDLAAFGAAHDARETQRDRKMLNLEWPAAEMLYLWVRQARRRRILEIGTSNGFSAIWLAAALPADGDAGIVSIDRSADKLAQARANLQRAGLADRVTLLQGEATAIVEGLAGPFDCVFFDADRLSAPDQLSRLLPRLADDACLLADNVLSHPAEVEGYLRGIEALGLFDSVTLPIGKGLNIAVRR
jgi:predicted O-methyltransferase YrrM